MQPKKLYIFIDPFNRIDSGVTSYINLASNLLKRNSINVFLLSKREDENIENFRERVKHEISTLDNILCIEAPESLAATKMLSDQNPLHIRLHCSRNLGAIVQGMKHDALSLQDEQVEIDKATYISSPSWAAFYASREIFRFKSTPAVYSNPAPQGNLVSPPSMRTYDYCFIGRFQKLKGAEHLAMLIEAFPRSSFCVLTPLIDNKTKILKDFKNVTLLDGSKQSLKQEALANSKAVLVPSIFETSSMVAIEALSSGAYVIAWEHLGICEYFNKDDRLIKIPPGNKPAFKRAMRKVIRAKNPNTVDVCDKLNEDFLNGTKNLLSRQKHNGISVKPRKTTRQHIKQLATPKTKMKKKQKSTFRKKFEKLIFHPVAFFRDSSEAKYIRKKIKEKKEKKLNALLTEFYGTLDIQSVTSTKNQNQNQNQNQTDQPLAVGVATDHIATKKEGIQINSYGRIEIKPKEASPKGHSVAFLFNPQTNEQLGTTLKNSFNQLEDFPYLSTERMDIGYFEVSPEESSLSILNRIDINNKTRLSNISYTVLLNAPPNICKAIRNSGTDNKVILIHTSDCPYNVDTQNIDAFITTKHINKEWQKARKLIALEKEEHISTALRRYLQETFPKKKDLLLALNINEHTNFTRKELLELNTSIYHGILIIKKTNYQKSETIQDIYEKLSPNILGIAVLESIYTRYKTLCDQTESGDDPRHLIEAFLKDGNIFHVKEL